MTVFSQFGAFSMTQSTVLTVANIAQFGLGYTVTKYAAEFRASDPAKVGRILGLCWIISLGAGIVAALGLFVAAPFLAADSRRRA